MKIEMGESLFYSWLRHVKECQIVQTNWKTPPQWTLLHQDKLEEIMSATSRFFEEKYGYKIYKQTSSLSQLLQQAECDVMEIAFDTIPSSPAFLPNVTTADEGNAGSTPDGTAGPHSVIDHSSSCDGGASTFCVYAVDVAFHEAGLNYGDREKTVMKILAKSLRTAMCIFGYLDSKDAEIIFASTKIGKKKLTDLEPCIKDAQELMDRLGYHFRFRVIANDDFREQILKPILLVSGGVADTNELFMRGYQMLQMFDAAKLDHGASHGSSDAFSTAAGKLGEAGADVHSPDGTVGLDGLEQSVTEDVDNACSELKVGQLTKIIMRRILEGGRVPAEEIQRLQEKDYSRTALHLNFPALVAEGEPFDRVRYYAEPVVIRGRNFFLCSQWSERPENNDRSYILKWIGENR